MLVNLQDVRQALDSDAVVPCYQPLVELRTGRLAGFEVLARWQHPKLGLILPRNFIAVAEEADLIEKLTQQILRKAFLAARSVPEHLSLAVNVSPIQLHDPKLPDQIQEAAESAQFSLKRLTVEITESALVNNVELALEISRRLKALGCKLALDDFGTGYSSLNHLQALPFDELKVDRSFVASMVDKRESRKIVAAVVGLGHSLGLATVAEGVETEEQAEMLLWLGCELGQGWLYGRPIPADQIPDTVAAAEQMVSSRMPAPSVERGFSSLEAMPALRLAQLHAIYESTPVGLCFLDRNLRYVSVNQRYADLVGVPMETCVGRTVMDIIPDVFPRIQPYIQRALHGESIADEEVSRPSRKPEGGELVTLLSYQPALDEAGELIGISVSVVDITECRRIEELLRESEDHYRLMVDLNPQVPWVLDAEGNVLEVSSRWMEITGLNKEQTRNLGWLNALHPDDVKLAMQVVRDSIRTSLPMDVEYRVWDVRRDGWHWLRARGSPLRGPTGKVISWYGSFEDIDERKQMEENLRRPQKA